ncbi:hypothetical protein [Streptomyces sp. UH6]|uniref:hypothetical protein n=1 Tax=Streptomyces sp. UH6 TaxID=2748379 RepID=UPI0015D4F7DC|nr:hypothetical protein [Streptomyces sp. UH6]NYV74080.1 hypothetical protein [Streptomyces sp. UH6]
MIKTCVPRRSAKQRLRCPSQPNLNPRSGPFPDQRPATGDTNACFSWSMALPCLYHQQTKNLLVSYSAKEVGLF